MLIRLRKNFKLYSIFVLFNLVMIYYFIKGFNLPIETNFWLIRFGLPLIILELFTPILVMFIPDIIIGKKFDIKSCYKSMIVVGLSLFFSFLLVYSFSNSFILIIFILSFVSKFFLIFSNSNINELKNRFYFIFILALTLILAFIVSGFLNYSGIEQQYMINYFTEIAYGIRQSLSFLPFFLVNSPVNFFNKPLMIFLWAVFYFIFISIFYLFEYKTGLPKMPLPPRYHSEKGIGSKAQVQIFNDIPYEKPKDDIPYKKSNDETIEVKIF